MNFTNEEIIDFITWIGYFDPAFIVSISHLSREKFANRLMTVAKVLTKGVVGFSSSKFNEMLTMISPKHVAEIASTSSHEEKINLLTRMVLSTHKNILTAFIIPESRTPISPQKNISQPALVTEDENKQSELDIDDFLLVLASEDPLVKDNLESPQKKRSEQNSPEKPAQKSPKKTKRNLENEPSITVVPATSFDNYNLPPFRAFTSILNNPVARLQSTTLPDFAPFMIQLPHEMQLPILLYSLQRVEYLPPTSTINSSALFLRRKVNTPRDQQQSKKNNRSSGFGINQQ